MPILNSNTRKRPWTTNKKNTSSGFNGDNKEFYNSQKWRTYSRIHRQQNRRCANCNKIHHDYKTLATDHIIPISQNGSKWDKRNIQSLCKNPCHMIKSAKESHGHVEPYQLNQRNERIPTNFEK